MFVSLLGSLSNSVYSAIISLIAGYGVKSFFARRAMAKMQADVKAAHVMLNGALPKAEADVKADVSKVVAVLSKWL